MHTEQLHLVIMCGIIISTHELKLARAMASVALKNTALLWHDRPRVGAMLAIALAPEQYTIEKIDKAKYLFRYALSFVPFKH